jgi:hypothetical protein
MPYDVVIKLSFSHDVNCLPIHNILLIKRLCDARRSILRLPTKILLSLAFTYLSGAHSLKSGILISRWGSARNILRWMNQHSRQKNLKSLSTPVCTHLHTGGYNKSNFNRRMIYCFGRTTMKVVPIPTWLCTSTVPPSL